MKSIRRNGEILEKEKIINRDIQDKGDGF